MTSIDVHSAWRAHCAALIVGFAAAFLLATPAQAQRISLSSLLARIEALEATVAQQQARIAELEADSVPGLADHVAVVDSFRDLDGDGIDEPVPTVLFEGANVQIVDGSGSTLPAGSLRPSGLGNLIVGYDEESTLEEPHCSDGIRRSEEGCENFGGIWAANQKNGSHNLVVGPEHFYSQAGGVVFGVRNIINGPSASATGGRDNSASGDHSSVSGGWTNTTIGSNSSISGGEHNTASGSNSSISGGRSNTTFANAASVSGGAFNTASNNDSSVTGGGLNTASGGYATVTGGISNTAANTGEVVP
jgi:hypothetical protein